MKTEEILFVLTFMFGVITVVCAAFKIQFATIYESLTGKIYEHDNIVLKSINWAGTVFTYFSLCYQVWFWFIFKLHVI